MEYILDIIACLIEISLIYFLVYLSRFSVTFPLFIVIIVVFTLIILLGGTILDWLTDII
jgi:hypothetical protein